MIIRFTRDSSCSVVSFYDADCDLRERMKLDIPVGTKHSKM